jgi:DNA-binding MarR family transcriptional regulator
MTSSTLTLETLITASSRLTRIAAQRTGSTVNAVTWPTLSILANDGPRRNGELARAARVSQPGMTKVLNQLVEDEWVSRIADVDDSRAWLIQITPRGRAALVSWRSELAAAMEPLFDGLSDDEWETLAAAAALLEARTLSSQAVLA